MMSGVFICALVEFGHDVPHGAVGVLASVFAYADGIVDDVARRGL